MTNGQKVVVAMSGGVDSSVAAALLVEQGYAVIGMMMRLWSEPGNEAENRCCTPDAMALARRVAAKLSIPFYAVDAQQVFRDSVVQYFISGYAQYATPNPCLACNRHIRWEFLLQRALALGAGYMATGHYARLRYPPGGPIQLLQAVDAHKDQSYVLHVLGQSQLQHALFPLGEYTKPEVRSLARKFDLPVAERPESQDLCFLGNSDYHSFLLRHAPGVANPGPILDSRGTQLGTHQGLAFYTIGQRKGLGVAAPRPLYVLEKDAARNALIVGRAEELGQDELTAYGAHWVSGEAPVDPFRAQIKIRYKAHLEWGLVTPQSANHFHIKFDSPLRDITPGQAAVIFAGEVCLGGGIISSKNQIPNLSE
jgi:tRNA-specific 2-thiouridylase